MNGFPRFLRLGLADAHDRLAHLTAFEPPDDGQLVAVVEASAIVRLIARVADTFRNAAQQSAFVDGAGAIRRAWLGQAPVQRARAVGAVLIIAGSSHLALLLWQGRPMGWLWVVVPALAMAIGLLMALAPSRGLREGLRP